MPLGRSGRNLATLTDVDFSKQVLPDFEDVILTDAPLQQARFRAVMLLSIVATVFLLLCIFSKSKPVKAVAVILMVIVVILAVVALANTLQSLGLQKVR